LSDRLKWIVNFEAAFWPKLRSALASLKRRKPVNAQNATEIGSSDQDVPGLRPALCLAEKMGKRLG
jgi:hypothetical protein